MRLGKFGLRLGKFIRIYVLNGLLIGAAVGAGFQLFLAAGKSFASFVDSYYYYGLKDAIKYL